MKLNRPSKRRAANEKGGDNAPDSGLNVRERRAFAIAQQAARRVMRRRFRILRLTREAYVKLGEADGIMSRVSDDLLAMLRFAKAWARREYRNVPWKTVVYIVAAIVYFVNPADLIPDILTGIGFVDDAAVVGAVVRSVHAELETFRHWEQAHLETRKNAPPKALSAAA